MYLDFEDYRPDIQPIGRAISWREGVLLSIIFHLVAVVLMLVAPELFPFDISPRQVTPLRQQEPPRFVFVQPRRELTVPRALERAEPSDRDRLARSPQRAEKSADPLPFSRGNTPERVDSVDQQALRGQGPRPDPAEGAAAPKAQEEAAQTKLPESPAVQFPSQRLGLVIFLLIFVLYVIIRVR